MPETTNLEPLTTTVKMIFSDFNVDESGAAPWHCHAALTVLAEHLASPVLADIAADAASVEPDPATWKQATRKHWNRLSEVLDIDSSKVDYEWESVNSALGGKISNLYHYIDADASEALTRAELATVWGMDPRSADIVWSMITGGCWPTGISRAVRLLKTPKPQWLRDLVVEICHLQVAPRFLRPIHTFGDIDLAPDAAAVARRLTLDAIDRGEAPDATTILGLATAV